MLVVVGPECDGLKLRIVIDYPPGDVDPAADDSIGAEAALADLLLVGTRVIFHDRAGDSFEPFAIFWEENHRIEHYELLKEHPMPSSGTPPILRSHETLRFGGPNARRDTKNGSHPPAANESQALCHKNTQYRPPQVQPAGVDRQVGR